MDGESTTQENNRKRYMARTLRQVLREIREEHYRMLYEYNLHQLHAHGVTQHKIN